MVETSHDSKLDSSIYPLGDLANLTNQNINDALLKRLQNKNTVIYQQFSNHVFQAPAFGRHLYKRPLSLSPLMKRDIQSSTSQDEQFETHVSNATSLKAISGGHQPVCCKTGTLDLIAGVRLWN